MTTMKPKRKKPKDDFFESPEYQKLLADIGGIIDEAKANFWGLTHSYFGGTKCNTHFFYKIILGK